MMLVLSILAAAGLIVLAQRKRLYAVAAVLFLLPSYLIRFDLFDIPMTMLETLILTLFIVFVAQERKNIRKLLTNRSWLRSPSFWLIAPLLVASIFNLLITPDLEAGLGICKAFILEPILFYLVLINTVKTEKDVRTVVWALGLSAAAISLIAAIQYLTGIGIPDPWHDFPNRRATSVYGFPNAVGLYVAPILTLFIGVLAHVKFFTRRNILLTLGMMMLMLFALIVARVEGALVAVAAGSVVILLFTKWWKHALIVSAVILVGVFAMDSTREILMFQDTSGDVRLALWEGTSNLLKEQPVFGAGLGAFPIVYDIYRLPSHVELLQYPHNIFLNFWVELGLLGLLWIIGSVIHFFRQAWVARKCSAGYSFVVIGVVVATLVYGLVDVPYFKNDVAVLFWIWLGLLTITSQLHDRTRNNPT